MRIRRRGADTRYVADTNLSEAEPVSGYCPHSPNKLARWLLAELDQHEHSPAEIAQRYGLRVLAKHAELVPNSAPSRYLDVIPWAEFKHLTGQLMAEAQAQHEQATASGAEPVAWQVRWAADSGQAGRAWGAPNPDPTGLVPY